MVEEAEADQEKGNLLRVVHLKLCTSIKLREQGLERRLDASKTKLLYLLMRYLSARLLKPQRLIRLSTQEEKACGQMS